MPCGICGLPSKDGLPHVDCILDERPPSGHNKLLISDAIGREEAIQLIKSILASDDLPDDHDGLAVRIVVNLDHALDPEWKKDNL